MAVPYLPVGHAAHSLLPEEAAYVPTAQLTQAVIPILYVVLPLGHEEHSLMPLLSPYLPAGHRVQVDAPVAL